MNWRTPKVGEIVEHDERFWIVGEINESRMRLDPLSVKKEREFVDRRTGAMKTVAGYGEPASVSAHAIMAIFDESELDAKAKRRLERLRTPQGEEETSADITPDTGEEGESTMGEDKVSAMPVAAKRKSGKGKAKAKGKTERKVKEMRECACACGKKTANFFVPGHDARYKGWMRKLADGRMEISELPASVKKAAGMTQLADGSWKPTVHYDGGGMKGRAY